MESWRVAVGEGEGEGEGKRETSVALDMPDETPRAIFVCGHGAGGSMSDRGVLRAAHEFVRRGLAVVRFNFLYKEYRSGRPDPMPVLQACYAAVVDDVRRRLRPQRLIVGGRSMGGRVASMLVAEGLACDGLLLLAYPLHPTGKPGQLRDAHLPAIRVPVLCFNGTRDDMCTPELMEQVLRRVHNAWQMHWIDGADHSFHVLKRSGRTDADVLAEIGGATEAWLTATLPEHDQRRTSKWV